MITEDEKAYVIKRFQEEGLDGSLEDDKKLPFVWRWLVDAETNCLSLRKQIDKLHKQHKQDLKEVETYVDQVLQQSNLRKEALEKENVELKQKLEFYERFKTQNKSLLMAKSSICDSLRLKSGFRQFFQNSKSDKSKKVVKDETDFKQLREMCLEYERVINIIEKSKQDLELERDTLVYKLSDALTNCEILEEKLVTSQKQKVKSHTFDNINSFEQYPPNFYSLFQKRWSSEDNIQDLKNKIKGLEKKYNLLLGKYEDRKVKEKQRMARLKDYVERETKTWQELLMNNQKFKNDQTISTKNCDELKCLKS